ncbi:M48 family metallopeptidase [Paenibacillus chibensis]|uniref:M48 family metallopeptidase n=1 Tax=Paenibacillus chibensis TaxID=59846 RepID=UPI000FD92A8A|nr:SprT family zinc-dependent metalloprotease [Paenibacillus chibensis]MEC0370115.1 SprT family zinc-dependent metalloprotease [Paenibacillus chibensis]
MINLTISGIEIIAEKKQIKNMYIRVVPPDGKVRITAPMSATDDAIRMFAISHISWIKKQRQKFKNQLRQTERKYVAGESYYLWGRRYRLDVEYSNIRNDVFVSGQKIVLQVRRDSTLQQRANVMENWYREILKEAIPPVFEKCEKLVGVKANEWQVKNMRTKWGTCNIEAKRIWLNLQLAKKTPECLEYVIIHELVHLLERSHNEIFRAYMDRFYPNWRAVKDHLNEQMLDHMEE